MKYSLIVAIYNRKDELIDLLTSLVQQTFRDFEVIIMDDGSKEDLYPIIQDYQNDLSLSYYKKENTGPGDTRNCGVEKASGEYVIFLDSDCIIPEQYMQSIDDELNDSYCDAFGGPDMAHPTFSNLQKAISYSMTSPYTTGGIRGRKKSVTRFQPRSFSMGVVKKAFIEVGGFSNIHPGEDPDVSMKLWDKGYSTRFFPKAGVYHKRRSTLKSFFRQVYKFGMARPVLNRWHPKYAKVVFWFPTLFLLGFSINLILFLVLQSIHIVNPTISQYINLVSGSILCLYLLYFFVIIVHSTIQHRSIAVGALSFITSLIQLFGYGWGFLRAQIKINLFRRNEKRALPELFFR